jgi:hypothetical protein
MPQEEASATVKKCAVDVARCESKAGLVEMDSEELRKVCLPSASRLPDVKFSAAYRHNRKSVKQLATSTSTWR